MSRAQTAYAPSRPATWRWRYADESYWPSFRMEFRESDLDTWKSWFNKSPITIIEMRLNNGQLVRMRRKQSITMSLNEIFKLDYNGPKTTISIVDSNYGRQD